MRFIVLALLFIKRAAYAVLWLLLLIRLLRFFKRVRADIMDHFRGPGFFTTVTGTWWIPLLFILGFWRHVYKRFPARL